MTTLIIISFTLFLFMAAALLVGREKSNSSKHNLHRVPGPRKLPLIGNLHLLLRSSPHHLIFRDLAAAHGPLMRLQLGQVPFLFASSVEVAAEVMKTHDVAFANRPLMAVAKVFTYDCTDIGLSPYGEYWRQLRKICTLELLSARRVRSFRTVREKEGANLVRWIAAREGSPANLTGRIYFSTFDVTSRAAVGREAEDKGELTEAVKELMKMGSGFSVADLYPSSTFLPVITGLNYRIQKLFRRLDRILEKVLEQHRESNAAGEQSEDLIDVLLGHQREDAEVQLSNDNIKAIILDMFLAGGETSATAVDWAMAEMIRNPNTLEKAQEEVRRIFDDNGYVDEEKFKELTYLRLVIKETLRLHPPLPLLVPRENSEMCEVNGYKIPAKTRLIVNAWAIGRDPKYWNEAEKFKPERFEGSSIDFKGNNLEFIPFGAGRRMCPGMSFGLANVENSLAMLLYHFDWKMPFGLKNKELDMTEVFGISVKRKQDLILIPTLKRPLTPTT